MSQIVAVAIYVVIKSHQISLGDSASNVFVKMISISKRLLLQQVEWILQPLKDLATWDAFRLIKYIDEVNRKAKLFFIPLSTPTMYTILSAHNPIYILFP